VVGVNPVGQVEHPPGPNPPTDQLGGQESACGRNCAGQRGETVLLEVDEPGRQRAMAVHSGPARRALQVVRIQHPRVAAEKPQAEACRCGVAGGLEGVDHVGPPPGDGQGQPDGGHEPGQQRIRPGGNIDHEHPVRPKNLAGLGGVIEGGHENRNLVAGPGKGAGQGKGPPGNGGFGPEGERAGDRNPHRA
jgi:hypothetical protein